MLKLLGTANRTGDRLALTNWGTATWTNAGWFAVRFTTFYNRPGALFDIQDDPQYLQNNSSGAFYNAGLFRKSAGTGTTIIQAPFYNTGTISPFRGTLQ